jgi:hypothetical protein
MLPLSLTCLDSLSHEPSFLVLLPLVRAHLPYLFKERSYCLYFLNLNLLGSL